MPLLTLDLGNTRVKGALATDPGSLEPLLSAAAAPELDAEARALLAALARRAVAIACASVAAPAVEEAVRAACRAGNAGVPFVTNPPSGLELAIEEPETCGADRLFAARAALARAGGSALVVDAGTAVTVDAVESSADNEAGQASRASQAGAAGSEPGARGPLGEPRPRAASWAARSRPDPPSSPAR